MHTINCNQKTGVFPMSDLAATNCQNSCSSGCGCGNDFGFNNCFWLILILLCCNNGNDCGCGNDNLIWLILILCCCLNGCSISTNRNDCFFVCLLTLYFLIVKKGLSHTAVLFWLIKSH